MSWKQTDDHYDEIDALKTELDSALNKLVQVLALGKSPDEAAWWVCANHASFIIDHPNLVKEEQIIEMAKRAGTPPRGENWRDWFDRVRNLKKVRA